MLMAELRVERRGPGRPRTRPDALRGDKAYSARGHRALLRSRGIVAVIPERADQIGHRKNRGARGGRPVGYDVEDYKNRNVVERFDEELARPGEPLRQARSRLPRRRCPRRDPRRRAGSARAP
jgi:hypothetical protein